MIGVKLKSIKDSTKNFILITTDGNYLPLIQRDLKNSRRNTCQKNAEHYDQKERCVEDARKEDSTNTFVILSKIKEYADEILKIYTLVDCLKRQLLNKFYSRFQSISKYSNSFEIQDTEKNYTNQSTTSFANSKDIEILYGPVTSKIRNFTENGITRAETTTEESSIKDNKDTTRTENHNINLNVSLPQISVRESGTQYTPKCQLKDIGIVTDHSVKEKINVATQNCESISIRVIKSNNENTSKLDKETCVRDAYVLQMANIDKRTKDMYEKYSVRKYYDKLLSYTGISHLLEKEVNYIDYHSYSLSNGICRYDQKYKDLLSYDHGWTKASISNFGFSSNQRVSRIPLDARSSCKSVQKKNEWYKLF